ncbi:uncharacterized oxidoreductase Tda5p [Trichomonascus vanleenenianus]|uniref:putative oxidoreductase Tda5p n=1 Tax=Trichomonascus vanleenenianus TaxID=2268995 RepID=UPI003ECAFB45
MDRKEAVVEQERLLEEKPPLSVDDLWAIIKATVLSAYGCWCFFGYYLLHDVDGFRFRVLSTATKRSFWYGVAVTAIHALLFLNTWLMSRPMTRLDPAQDVIAITGGCGGLGRKLTALLITAGYRVAVLDVADPETKLPGTLYIKCDVSDPSQVREARDTIEQEFGTVTVLVNNAGIITSGKALLELEESEIERTMKVNSLGHFWTVRTFLPGMLGAKRGYVVTVGSILGVLGPAKCSAYSASKGALSPFHDTLAHEYRSQGIKTLLVVLGQLDSDLFRGVRTPSSFVAPLVKTTDAAVAIVRKMEQGVHGELVLPLYASLIPFIKLLPRSLVEFARSIFKMDSAMDSFEGRKED